jgi:hypothetical protein
MLALLLTLQAPWWDAAWTYRRALTVRNGTDAAFAAGLPVELEIDPDFLGLRDKARPGLADLAVVRGGRRIAHVLRPSLDGRRLTLAFPLAEEIKAGGSDAGYALYYGNAEGRPPAERAFYAEDFSGDAAVELGALTGGVRDGALELRDAPAERTAIAPERVKLNTGAIPTSFTLTFDLEAVFTNAPALAVCLEVAALDPAVPAEDLKPVAALVERLGAEDFEEREKATAALIALGPAALPALAEALRSSDVETRTRAERVVAAIRKAAPPPLIRAGLVSSDVLWRTAAVGGASSSQGAGRPADGGPRRFRFEITREPEGHVTIACDGQRLQRGALKAPPGSISIAAWKTSGAKPAPIRLDNLYLRPFVDPTNARSPPWTWRKRGDRTAPGIGGDVSMGRVRASAHHGLRPIPGSPQTARRETPARRYQRTSVFAWSSGAKCSLACLMDSTPILSASSGWSQSQAMWAARLSVSPGAERKPVTPSTTNSCAGPPQNAITGRPAAIVSEMPGGQAPGFEAIASTKRASRTSPSRRSGTKGTLAAAAAIQASAFASPAGARASANWP